MDNKGKYLMRLLSFLLIGSLLYLLWGRSPLLAQEKVLKIGVSVSLTGRLSREGHLTKDGYDLWADYVNKKGGIDVGGTKYKVELIYYDDKSDPMTSAKLTEKLITEDKVDFILGPYSSIVALSTSSICEKYRYVNLQPLANAETIYNRGYKYVFSIIPPAPKYLQGLLELATGFSPKPKTVAIISADDLFPLMVAEGVKTRAKELGYELVYSEKYPKDAKDLSSILMLVKAKDPDILLGAGYFEDAVLIVRQSKDLRISPRIMGFSVGPQMPDFRKVLGKDADYVYGCEWWTHNMNWKCPVFGSASEWVRLVKERYGYVPSYHPAAASATGVILQLGLEKAGSLDQDKLRDVIRDMEVEIFFGPMKWDERGRNIAGSTAVVQIQKGNLVTVAPLKFKEGDVLYPTPLWEAR